MIIDILKLDHEGRGIGYSCGKIVFCENALPGETVKIDIIKEKSKYIEAKSVEVISPSKARINTKCPYFNECGGCHVRYMNYEDTLLFKKNKVLELLKKNSELESDIEVIKSDDIDNYRNKITLHIEKDKIGFYKQKTHDIVEINNCLNVNKSINDFIKDIDKLNLLNATVTIRSNYNNEILVSIITKEKVNVDIDYLREHHKLVGIVVNDETIYGSNNFIEIINNMLFRVTYNSFFQVNRNITGKLFDILKNSINSASTVLDLCSGVGTLSIVAANKAQKVYAIEIVENAVKDALLNAKMNKKDNINFILGDAFTNVSKISDEIDTVIIDPPRSGLNLALINSIFRINPEKIIYISCDPNTLTRDLAEFKDNYSIKKMYILDMFPYTYHCETICVLERK